jgi:hypothetical protein
LTGALAPATIPGVKPSGSNVLWMWWRPSSEGGPV